VGPSSAWNGIGCGRGRCGVEVLGQGRCRGRIQLEVDRYVAVTDPGRAF